MTDKHPYTPAQGPIVQTITQFRKSFPQSVTSDTLKKLGIAPKNESRVIHVLKFLGLLDEDGSKTEISGKVFSIHIDDEFQKEFGLLISAAYNQLFDLHKENAWELPLDSLISFFRTNDGSTDLVGKLQAQTFQVLAGLAGHETKVKQTVQKTKVSKNNNPIISKTIKPLSKSGLSETSDISKRKDIGLTVRIEINLPSDGNQETYDRIFKSIRENLINE